MCKVCPSILRITGKDTGPHDQSPVPGIIIGKELAKNLGEPIHDGVNLGAWRKLMFGMLGADLDYLTSVVVWGRAKEDVMLLVRETEDKRWEVTISQGSSKTEYILNS